MKNLFKLICLLQLLVNSCTTTGTKTDFETWKIEQAVIRSEFQIKHAALLKRVNTTRIKSPYFWKIEKNGKSSWILGTIQQGVDASSLPLAITNKIAMAKTVIMEIDTKLLAEHIEQLSSKNDFEWMAQLDPLLPTDKPLDKLIGDEAWGVFSKDMRPVQPEILKKLTPPMAKILYLMLRAELLGEDLACMDCSLQRDAIAAKRPLLFLETPKSFLDVLRSDRLDDEVSAEDLKTFLTNNPLQSVSEHIEATYQLALNYKLSNIANTEADSKSNKDYRELTQKIQATWLAKLIPHLSAGEAFVAIDVERLIGPRAMLTELQKSGFSVTRWDDLATSVPQKPVR